LKYLYAYNSSISICRLMLSLCNASHGSAIEKIYFFSVFLESDPPDPYGLVSLSTRFNDPFITPYCDGAEWHGETMMLISQFMDRLARANRAPKSTHQQRTSRTDRGQITDRQTQDTGVISSIELYSDVHSEKYLVSAYSGPGCLLLSPPQVLYGQRQLADPYIPSSLHAEALCLPL
jgi:hypothetical protein